MNDVSPLYGSTISTRSTVFGLGKPGSVTSFTQPLIGSS
jgi:hypothetical protein